MPAITELAAEVRQRAGKGAARACRREGRVPAVIYGGGDAPLNIHVRPQDLIAQMRRSDFYTKLFDVVVDGKKHRCMARDVQLNVINDLPIHVDFLRVSGKTRLNVEVPVHFHNQEAAPGIKRGGVLEIVRHEVEVVCTVDNMPASLDVDLTGMDVGDSIHISHVNLPDGVEPTITDRDFTIASIVAPSGMKSAEAEEAEAAEEG